MSTLELNKIVGAILVTLLTFWVIDILAHSLVQPRHDDAAVHITAAPPREPAAPAAPAEVEPVEPLLAAADVGAGEAVTRRCTACHTFEKGGPNRVGPNLWDIVNADKAHLDGFSYSPAMAGAEGTWTYENLNRFLADPRGYMPGTRMVFAGLRSVNDRANLIAYLRMLSDEPTPLPQPGAAEAPAADTQGEARPAD